MGISHTIRVALKRRRAGPGFTPLEVRRPRCLWFRSRNRLLMGFTLIETIVAFAVLTTALVGFITLVAISLNSFRTARLSYTAAKIAQEGMELAVSKRDNHVLSEKSKNVRPALDASPNKNHGNIMNGAKYKEGKYGDAIDFEDNKRHYIVIPDSPTLDVRDGLTMAMWIKKTGPPDNAGLIHRAWGDLYADFWGLFFWADEYNVSLQRTSNTSVGGFASVGPIVDGWVHIAGTYDKTNLKIYKDGVPMASTPLTGFIPQENNMITIGTEMNNDGAEPLFFFNGRLDDVYLYNRALSPAELTDVMNNTSPPAAGLVGHWKLDDEIPPGLDDWQDNLIGTWEADAAKIDQLLPQNKFNSYDSSHFLCLKTAGTEAGKFGYCTGAEKPIFGNFRRKVEIIKIDGEKIHVRVTVDWETKTTNRSLVIEEILYGLP